MSDLEKQLQIEQSMKDRGEARERSRIAKSMSTGEAASTPAGVALMKRALAPMVATLEAFMEHARSNQPTRRAVAARLLEGVSLEVASYITIRTALSFASARKSLRSVAVGCADRLMSELIAEGFEEANGPLYRAVLRNAQERGLSPAFQETSVRKANRQFEVVEERWTTREKLLLGTKLVETLIESTGIVEVYYRDRTPMVKLGAGLDDWFAKFNNAACLTRPLLLPMVIPPQKWSSPEGSPYFSNLSRHRKIITRGFPGQLEALKEADLSVVYDGINAMQETPWRINKRLLTVMKVAWEQNLSLPCMPKKEDVPLPPVPEEVVNDVRGGPLRKAWRVKMRGLHEANASSRSQRFEFARAIDLAVENAQHAAIYFPHRLDFRGRAYASTTTLNPQGADNARALLEFSEGKELGDDGVFWLGVHGANLYGNDKVSLADRHHWAHDNWRDIIESANYPFQHLWWTKADKPWSFLAWCFEWAEMWGSGEEFKEFVSHIPVALDGSCNGIQHFSAMLRDEVGGAAVNLIPSNKPQDIYGEVASCTTARLEELMDISDVEEGGDRWMAATWLQFGIDRKITKRAVMVLPYGGTFKSCMDYVREAVKERGPMAADAFGDALPKATAFLAKVVWAAIGEVVIGARTAMQWLQQVSRIASKHGVTLEWTTPSGFKVVQRYRKPDDQRLTTRFQGSTVKYRGFDFTDTLDKAKQASAVSPNFVHALDASAMMLTIGACKRAHIKSFAMIHDSYGTHAADTEFLGKQLRYEFYRMYTHNDVLQQFYEEIVALLPEEARKDVPMPPAYGSLDLSQVLDSLYFFA